MSVFAAVLVMSTLYACTLAAVPWGHLASFSASLSQQDPAVPWATAIAAYVISHLLRIARLTLLLADTGKSVREMASANFCAALATLVAPYRLGELVRLAEYYRVADGRFVPAVSTLIVERFFDASILLLIGVFAAFSRDGVMQDRQLVLGLVAVVWLLFVLAYATLPTALAYMRTNLLTRGRGRGSIQWLRLLGVVEDTWTATRSRIQDRGALLWLFSMLVWCAELAAFGLAGGAALTSITAAGYLATLEQGLESATGAAGLAIGYPALTVQVLTVVGAISIPFALRGWFLLGRKLQGRQRARYRLLQETTR